MSLRVAINRNILEMEYAVRGPIPQRAAELRKHGRVTIACNIGNPQALGQKPISYYRQVLSLLEEPSKIARERRLNGLVRRKTAIVQELQDEDLISDYVLDLAEHVLSHLKTGMGAYTESQGPLFIRQAIAQYIDKRDGVASSNGVPSDPDRIILTNGASEGAKYIIEMLIAKGNDGIMIPVPQYPLYSAAIKKCGGQAVGYYPDEDSGWTLTRSVLDESLTDARRRGITVKAIVVINPCNPTGAILEEKDIKDVIEFAGEHGLAIIADEVYQENVYGARFVSFAEVLGRRDVPLFSLHSTSKGFYGECGHRGGYLEVRNPPEIEGARARFMDVLVKQASVSLCANTTGQALTYLMVNPPQEGSEPYPQFVEEKEGILRALYDKAAMIRDALRRMDGVECFGRIGAMYLFPRLNRIPQGTTDFDYCMNLLEETGLCTVNGSGFGQKEGTHHLRIACLPAKELLQEVLPKWIEFHNAYVGKKC